MPRHVPPRRLRARGALAGREAALAAGFRDVGVISAPPTDEEGTTDPAPAWTVHSRRPRPRRAFVDLQNDTTAADLDLAVREGFESIEHIKRYTLLGFGTDQGKTGNVNGMALAAGALGRSPAAVGTTTFRPPIPRSPSGRRPVSRPASSTTRSG